MPPDPIASRPQLSLKAEFALAFLPTVTTLAVFALVEAWSREKMLFASLASSAFFIYLDPEHEASSVRTVVIAQTVAALVGFAGHALGNGNPWVSGLAMMLAIGTMIVLGVMHPPAVSTALSFALTSGTPHAVLMFGLCVLLLAALVLLQQEVVRRWNP